MDSAQFSGILKTAITMCQGNRQFVPRWESDWNGEIEGITSNWTPQNPYINATELTFQSGITLTDYDDFGYLLGYEIEADFVPPFSDCFGL